MQQPSGESEAQAAQTGTRYPAFTRPVPFPAELLSVRQSVQAYVNARIRQFGGAFAQLLNLQMDDAQLEEAIAKSVASLGSKVVSPTRTLRLVLRHDCMSTGCGEPSCLLCQFNPSRLCRRNLKNKYLIDDHIKAKCNAPLRVELVDESGACVLEGLPPGMQLEVHVLNGEKYREICPDNVLLSHQQLRACIISHHTKALLRRENSSDDQLRCFLQLETGTTSLSDLQVTTSSEALLSGKAPTFRLLVWAVDERGEPVSNVTYVVSENFVVATKRVKHAIKSDIPSITDSVSKLVHIGKATVEKLHNLRQAASEEGFVIQICDELNRLEKVGQFQQLVELSELNPDLKQKVRHLLKLSPEKWEEVAQHAQGAVMPDFRPRAWWCPSLRAGLLFGTKNGAVCMDQPIALVKMGASPGDEDEVVPVAQLDPNTQAIVPRLKAGAVQSWYSPQHPGWSIYYKEGTGVSQDPVINASIMQQQQAAGQTPNLAAAGPSSVQAASNMATLTNSSMATPPVGGVMGPNLLADAQGTGVAQRAAATTNAADGMGGATRGAGRGAAEGGAGARRRAECAETAAAATAAPTATNTITGTAAAAGGASGSAQASGSRTSGRKRKPTQLPGAHSPKRDSAQGCAAERQAPQPLVVLPPPGTNVQLPPLSHANAASGVQQPLGGVVGGQPEVLGFNPVHLQVQMPVQGFGAGGVEAGVQGRPTHSLPDLSPFATPGIMGNLAGHFPCWQQQPQQQAQQPPLQQQQQQQQHVQGAQQPMNGPTAVKPQQQDSFVAMLPSGLGGASSSGLPSLPNAANGAAQLLPVHTGGSAGQAGEQAAQPGAAAHGGLESGALLLASNPLANPLMSHLPFSDTIGGSFNMPSFTLPGANGVPASGGLQGLQGSGSLQLNSHGPQPPSLNGSMQLGSPALGNIGGGLQANGDIGSGSLQLNTSLLPQENSIENGVLPIPKLARTEPHSASAEGQ